MEGPGGSGTLLSGQPHAASEAAAAWLRYARKLALHAFLHIFVLHVQINTFSMNPHFGFSIHVRCEGVQFLEGLAPPPSPSVSAAPRPAPNASLSLHRMQAASDRCSTPASRRRHP